MDSTKDGVSCKNAVNTGRKSFVVAISENLINSDRNLECIPTQIEENGVEVVVFDDIMVAEGRDMDGEVCKGIDKVAYDWKPLVCNDCGVLRHADNSCPKREPNKPASVNCRKDNTVVHSEEYVTNAYKEGNDRFVEVKNKKNVGIDNKVKRQNYKANPQTIKSTYKNVPNESHSDEGKSEKSTKKWSVHKDILDAVKD
nr:hypothetical protein [Tanacetum cinerariifolium]